MRETVIHSGLVLLVLSVAAVTTLADADPGKLPGYVAWTATQPPPPPPPPPPAPAREGEPAPAAPPPPAPTEAQPEARPVERTDRLHKGVDNFFNIREAYSDVLRCEFEFSADVEWATYSDGHQDRVFLSQQLKYGITDTLHVGLKVLEPLGYGGDGVGETELTVFNNCWEEGDWLPAFSSYLKSRFPSGHESSKLDGTVGGIFTKTICKGIRAHVEGWITFASGEPGWWEWTNGGDRRHFQWGLGPGFDFELAENTVAVLNYVNRVSEAYGDHNSNILEAGLVHRFGETDRCFQRVKLAVDVGLDGQEETPNLGAKLQWEINFR